MSVDWTRPEFVFLLNKLKQGQVCLFAGAGFSLGAKNRTGSSLPLGRRLAELLAKEAGEAYGGESLPTVFEAVETTIGTNNLWRYLQSLYKVETADEWYRIVTSLSSYRIYTTNIDDLLQFLLPYPSGQKLDLYVRGDQPQERGPHFEQLQCVHLHGHVDHRRNGLTFTPGDFATRSVVSESRERPAFHARALCWHGTRRANPEPLPGTPRPEAEKRTTGVAAKVISGEPVHWRTQSDGPAKSKYRARSIYSPGVL